MLRTRLSQTLGAFFLCMTSLAAQASTSTSDCTSGRGRGGWDLPSRSGAGHVRGVLTDPAGHRLAFEARLLTDAEAGLRSGGKIVGVLRPMTREGIAGKPIAEVHGTYVVSAAGLGRFEAAIVGLDVPEGARPTLIGKLGGEFADPLREGGDSIGRFVARWTICR